MMKWKVVKNPRSASADRSLECLRNDVQPQTPAVKNDNNNNNSLGEENNNSKKQINNNGPQVKETNKQRDTSLTRKSSVVATDCLNLKSFLGLSRQRSETNLSNLGLKGEPRRSRSEVRGLSCDRLAVGYHTTPQKAFENGQTRSSSPPLKSGCWIRGRKRERESRNPVKNNLDAFGKTIVTGSNGKSRTSSKTRHGDCRTIADSCDNKQKSKVSSKSASESRKNRNSKRNGEDDIIIEEEVIYTEIDQENVRGKLLDENKEIFKDPKKVVRKKGMAPKPQIAAALFKEISGMEVNLNPNGITRCGTPNSYSELCQLPVNRKSQQRRNQTYNGRNQDKKADNRLMNSVKLNNLKNNEKDMWKPKNNMNSQSVVAVVEVHKQLTPSNSISTHINSLERTKSTDGKDKSSILLNNKDFIDEIVHTNMDIEDPPPYHIDTPDYSTLDSVHCCGLFSSEDIPFSNDDIQIPQDNTQFSQDDNDTPNSQNDTQLSQDDTPYSQDDMQLSQDDIPYSQDDVLNCNAACVENTHESSSIITSQNAKRARDISLSGILRDSSNEIRNSDSEPKKTVHFEKIDLIEKYKKHKSESMMDTENNIDASTCDPRPLLVKNVSDFNSNDIVTSDTQSLYEDHSQCCDTGGSDSIANVNCIKLPSEETSDVEVNFRGNNTDNSESKTNCVHKNSKKMSQTVTHLPRSMSNSNVDESLSETSCHRSMTVNVYVRNPTPTPMVSIETSPLKQCVVKKSFVLTVAKQENGFRSLCANKKPYVQPEEEKNDQQISVTFLCSGPPSESWVQSDKEENFRLRSISVPPRSLQQQVTESVVSALRGRSRERRPKEKIHYKKSKSKKKEATVFVMPQAVIDELSQVLEKRKPSSLVQHG